MKQKEIVSGYTNAFWNGFTTLELAKIIELAIEQNITGLYQPTPKAQIAKYDLLVLLKIIFDKQNKVNKITLPQVVDKTLKDTRQDFQYQKNTYNEMLKELKIWMENNSKKYKRYLEEV
jgi:dTDP-4-dehydrorhamnose reductase